MYYTFFSLDLSEKIKFFEFYTRTIQKDLFTQCYNYLFSTRSEIHQDSFTCGCHGNLGSLDCWEILRVDLLAIANISSIIFLFIVCLPGVDHRECNNRLPGPLCDRSRGSC